MHGLILLQLQKYVTRVGGPFAWQMIHDDSGNDLHSYSPSEVYSDESTIALISAASRAFSQTQDEFLESFGRYICPELLSLYRHAIDRKWRCLDLLQHTALVIHAAIRAQLPGVVPPRLEVLRGSDCDAIVRYHSPRKMCTLFRGIVRGMSEELGESIRVSERVCCRQGSPFCEFVVSTDRNISAKVSAPASASTTIATATHGMLTSLFGLAANEGWLPTVGQAALYYSVDPSAGKVLLVNGQVRGGITGFAISPQYGAVGNLVVSPELRGVGNGTRLFEDTLDSLKGRVASDATLALDAQPYLLQFFMRYSFFPSLRFLRMKVHVGSGDASHVDLRPAREIPLSEIIEFDAQARGFARDVYFHALLDNEGSQSFAAVIDSRIVGFCSLAPIRRGFRIRDLVCKSVSVATAMLDECLRRSHPDPVFIDLCTGNRYAKELAAKFGMAEILNVSRLYQGKPPEGCHDWVFGMSLFG